MKSSSEKVKAWRTRTKERLAAGFGGSCCKCKYDICLAALDFHHIDQGTKSFDINKALANPVGWDRLIEEAAKCVMLCCRCHRELHCGLWRLDEIEIVHFRGQRRIIKKLLVTSKCPTCGADVFGGRTYCSATCGIQAQKKAAWPEPVALRQLLREQPLAAIARSLGVSTTAVRKKVKRVFDCSVAELVAGT